MLKNIVKGLEPSSTLKINEISGELEDKGEKIFKFGFGQSPFQIPNDIVNALKDNAYQNKYLPMQGLKELRETVAKYTSTKKGYNYKSENVIIGPGSKELMFLLHVLFDGEIIFQHQVGFLMLHKQSLEEIEFKLYKQKEKIIGFLQEQKLKKLF